MISAPGDIASQLPRKLRRAVHGLFSRLRGVKRIPLIHEEIARRINRSSPVILEIGCNGGDTPGGWDLSGSIRRPKNHIREHPWVKFDHVITVKTGRLDDWCAENDVKRVDFIWMDVQGAEGDVIAGGAEILKSTRYLYTEYSNTETYEGQLSLKALLKKVPLFDVVARYASDVLLINRNISG
jgi:hypothetical protein